MWMPCWGESWGRAHTATPGHPLLQSAGILVIARHWGHSTEKHALLVLTPGVRGHLYLTSLFGAVHLLNWFFHPLATESQDGPPPLLSPYSFPLYPAPSPPAPNHCSFLPQVYRPRKQPLSMNMPCTCDAGYSPDITAKYHGSSYDAYMIQRSQVSQPLRRHSPPPVGWGYIRAVSHLDLPLFWWFPVLSGHKFWNHR